MTGYFRPERALKKPCTAQCIHKCTINFSMEERKKLHEQFWKFTEFEKRKFFTKHVERIAKKRQYVKAASRRTYTYVYYFHLLCKRLQVCKIFFLNTLDICSSKIYLYFEKFHDEATGHPKPMEEVKRKCKSVCKKVIK